VLSAAAHQGLDPGRHHLAGAYDGRTIQLYVDGALVAEREGSGKIQNTRVPVTVGRIQGGAGRFRGDIHRVRISNRARGARWLVAAAGDFAGRQ
jgi:hypothetical protein